MADLTLAPPSLEFEAACLACAADFQRAGETFLGGAPADYRAFVQQAERSRQGDVADGKVPQNDYFLLRDGATILGLSGLRHALTPALRDIGGHIGYRIRPSERRKGYGTRLLALVLVEARQLGLDEVLLTCDSDNIGSRRIIERNGGQLASEGPAHNGVLVARYWIHLGADGTNTYK
jgi:predicted acetyltransferase